MTLDPVVFCGVLASTLLSLPEIEGPFRLVADNEFSVIDYLSTDSIFASSKLFAGGEPQVGFSYSYKGFPSDAIDWSNKAEMNIVSRLNECNVVSYLVKRIIDVRFFDQNYQYPNEEWTWLNIRGEGKCMMKVFRD